MKNLKTKIKISLFLSAITIFMVLLMDLIIGRFFLKHDETVYRVRHTIFHHTLKKNFSSKKALWANGFYEINTDMNGFKVSKINQERKDKNFDILIIGDSQAEGIGFKAEKTYYGLLEKKFPKFKIANMAVGSYSTQIYLSKLNYYYENNFYFDHVILHFDISDLFDDYFKYEYDEKNNITLSKMKSSNYFPVLLNSIIKIFPLTYKIYHYFKNYDGLSTSNKRNIYNIPAGQYMYKDEDVFFKKDEREIAIKKTLYFLSKIHNLIQKNNGNLSILITPWPSTLKYYDPNNILENEFKNFCISRCKNFLNFFPDFLDLSDKFGYQNISNEYFLGKFDDQHFSEKGHFFMAELLYNKIK